MYYVIKRQTDTNPMQVMGFKVPKYITNKSSDTVIFEFIVNAKTVRKWVKKEEVILLTEDKEFYLKTMKDFKHTQETQKKLVAEAQDALDKSIETYSEVMVSKLEDFEEIRNSRDIPCILKDL